MLSHLLIRQPIESSCDLLFFCLTESNNLRLADRQRTSLSKNGKKRTDIGRDGEDDIRSLTQLHCFDERTSFVFRNSTAESRALIGLSNCRRVFYAKFYAKPLCKTTKK